MIVKISQKKIFDKIRIFFHCPSCKHAIILDKETFPGNEEPKIECSKCLIKYLVTKMDSNSIDLTKEKKSGQKGGK